MSGWVQLYATPAQAIIFMLLAATAVALFGVIPFLEIPGPPRPIRRQVFLQAALCAPPAIIIFMPWAATVLSISGVILLPITPGPA